MDTLTNPTQNLKFYSSRAIGIATILGGPLAAGYLIKENYNELNEIDKGRTVFIYGVVASVILFGGFFLIPEHIMENIPRQIIPIAYTAAIYFYVNSIQGATLDKHKEFENKFHSAWKAVLIGIISLIIILIIVVGTAFLIPKSETIQQYDNNIETFSNNEETSLTFYDHLDIFSDDKLVQELNESVIPKWQENVALIKQNAAITDVPIELREQSRLLLKYSELRLEAFIEMKKGLEGNFDDHEARINMLHIEIDTVLAKLNAAY